MTNSVITAEEYDIVNHEETELSPEILAKIRNWLQPTDYLADSGEFRRHLASQAPGTGLWICETDEYRKWHDSPDHGSLWIKGVPGAGKSVTAASIIQHLRVTESCPVLFFFFRNIVAANFSPRALIQDWLAQLLPHSPKLQFALQARLETSLEDISDNDLVQIFLDGVSCVPKVYCVGDALDEMTTDNRPFLDKLNGLATYRPRSLKLLMTSRPKQYLQSALRDSSIVHISLQQRLVDADILSYLHHRFETTLKSDEQQHIKQQVISMVESRAEGLFLYAKLTMDQFEAALLTGDPVDINALEQSLPVGLEQTYTSMLAKQRREKGVSTDLQVFVLEAVTHASRPLRLNELASLLEYVYTDIQAPNGFKVLIATCCGSLVEILEDETLQVIHHSFTEFLRGDSRNKPECESSEFPVIDSDKAHKRMAINCLRYLQSGSLLLEDEDSDVVAPEIPVPDRALEKQAQGRLRGLQAPSEETSSDSGSEMDVDFNDTQAPQKSQAPIQQQRPLQQPHGRLFGDPDTRTDPFNYLEARLRHPFLHYAVENWSYHASRYDVEDEALFNAVLGFLRPDSLSLKRWLNLKWRLSSYSSERVPTALHIAAFAGLSQLAIKLIQQGSSVSATDSQYRIPIHWACENGHAKVVSLLIHHGSDPDAVEGFGMKPLHLAAPKNHASVVTILLQAGVKPDTAVENCILPYPEIGFPGTDTGTTAITYASQGGHPETAIAMIPFCQPEILEDLLCEYCQRNQTDAVLAILDKSSVSANAVYEGSTALHLACNSINERCVRALINRGADVLKTSNWMPRNIHLHCIPEPRRESEEPPLHRLVYRWLDNNDQACQAIFRLLIKAGADLEQVGHGGNTALHIAAGDVDSYRESTARLRALRALIDAGADVNKTNSCQSTALHVVLAGNRDLEAVRLLVEHGCEVNARDYSGTTALQRAVSRNSMSLGLEHTEVIVKYLLDHGADPDIKGNHQIHPVVLAMRRGPSVFQMVLSRSKDESIKKRCWFELADDDVSMFVEHLEILLAEGVNIDTRKNDGRTLYLCCLNFDDKLDDLQSHGANIDAVDNGGNNALHVLFRDQHCTIEQAAWLVDRGIDPLSRNNNGDTLLHHVASRYTSDPFGAEFVRWLIGLGISVNAVNERGRTALHVFQERDSLLSIEYTGDCSRKNGHVHFVDVINIGKNVDFEIRDEDGLTALHLSAMRSEIEAATLLTSGADLRVLTDDLQNVLHLACRARQPNIVGLILDQPGLLDSTLTNEEDVYGRTPLHYACSSGKAESVALLLKHGARARVSDLQSSTPLHACAEFKLEQSLWDANDQPWKWLRCPPEDRLRPRCSESMFLSEPRYKDQHGRPQTETRKTFFPSVGTIARMLIDAKVDVAATSDFRFTTQSRSTALDLAIRIGCSELIEVFAQDEKLYAEATKNLGKGNGFDRNPEKTRRHMELHMSLMRPRSCLDTLSGNATLFNELLESPVQFLNLFTIDDAVKLISQGFEANPLAESCYHLLEELMKPDHLELSKRLSPLILHYSSYDLVGERARRFQEAIVSWHGTYTALTPLQLACMSAEPNMLMLRLLVEELHVDVNAHGLDSLSIGYTGEKFEPNFGGTALHILATADNYWHLEAIEYLLSQGADTEALDKKGQSPLHIAAEGTKYHSPRVEGFWRLNALTKLLDHGADPNLLDKEYLSPLHKASAAPEIISELLSRGAQVSERSQNPILRAIKQHNLLALETLLDHGLSVDSFESDHLGRSLSDSMNKPRRIYALLLVALGGGLNASPKDLMPLLRALVTRGANLYLPLNDDETMVHFLFEFPEHEVADELLKEPCVSRINFDRRDQHGRTVLMASCNQINSLPGYGHRRWDAEVVTGPPLRILDRGADARLVDEDGKTALHYLLDNPIMPDDILLQFMEREEVAPTLMVKDKAGFSPLHYSLRSLRPKACELLLAKGANILEPSPDGLTALHYIASQCLVTTRMPIYNTYKDEHDAKDYFDRCLALWKRFLDEGGPINEADNAGNTALHVFLLSGDMEIFPRGPIVPRICHLDHYNKLFPPDSGVDVFAANHEGETMLHVIPRRGKPAHCSPPDHDKALFEAMMDKGLDPLKEDAKGRSALDVASAYEKDDIVGILSRK
ncbi:hypothetical protein FZEAL_2489 [Fusarium zealandicum]|uniref:NACHT domain-containing protein n=1 Tax=Fusarium zealandicum TaxID=1053134 RepID=A0A8H4URC9_9HYPO|nr:hypothetical protein FZEAL_2489 [Fusarium zealandicum]